MPTFAASSDSESTTSLSPSTISLTKLLSSALPTPPASPFPSRTRSTFLSRKHKSVHPTSATPPLPAAATLTSTPSVSSSPQAGSHQSIQPGAFVGIGLGSVFVVVGFALLCIYLLRRRKRRTASESRAPASDIPHEDPSHLETASVRSDARRGERSPRPRSSNRGNLGWREDRAVRASHSDGTLADGGGGDLAHRATGSQSETDTVGSGGGLPGYEECQAGDGGVLVADGLRNHDGGFEEFGDDSRSEATMSTLLPPYTERRALSVAMY